MEIQVVPKKFLDSIENNKVDIPDLVTKMSICGWGADVSWIRSFLKFYSFREI